MFFRPVNIVTQSYENSFWGNVFLDTFNDVSRDEDNIWDQIYMKQIWLDFYHEDLKFWEWLKKMHILKKYSSLQERAHKIGFYF